ncbi:MAG: TIM barrel protein [Pirellulales bacterium]
MNTNRREFLRDISRLGGGALTMGRLALTGASARGIEPFVRPAGAKFKFSLAAYSYRQLLTDPTSGYTLNDFVDDCAKMGLDGTELTSYYFPESVTPDYVRSLKAHCFRQGLDVSGTAIANDFCYPPGNDRDAQLAHVRSWVDHAETLGAPVIRVFSGKPRDGQDDAEARRLAIAGMEEACVYAGEHGVYLGLENHGGLSTHAEDLLSIVRDVKSPWFGVNLDTGNFHSADPYADIALLAPYAVNVQVKVSIHPDGGSRQPADFRRLASILRDSDYRGYVALEYEEEEDAREACPRYVDELRDAFLG